MSTPQRTGKGSGPATAQEFRAFVRRHHPDVGGDPEVFAAGVARWREAQRPAPQIVFYRKRKASVLVQVLDALWTRLPAPRRRTRPTDRRVR